MLGKKIGKGALLSFLGLFIPSVINPISPVSAKQIKVDGKYGKETETEVKEFQKGSGLENNGIYGQRTLAELKKQFKEREIELGCLNEIENHIKKYDSIDKGDRKKYANDVDARRSLYRATKAIQQGLNIIDKLEKTKEKNYDISVNAGLAYVNDIPTYCAELELMNKKGHGIGIGAGCGRKEESLSSKVKTTEKHPLTKFYGRSETNGELDTSIKLFEAYYINSNLAKDIDVKIGAQLESIKEIEYKKIVEQIKRNSEVLASKTIYQKEKKRKSNTKLKFGIGYHLGKINLGCDVCVGNGKPTYRANIGYRF